MAARGIGWKMSKKNNRKKMARLRQGIGFEEERGCPLVSSLCELIDFVNFISTFLPPFLVGVAYALFSAERAIITLIAS